MNKLNNVTKKVLFDIMTPLFTDGHDKEQAVKVMAMYKLRHPEDFDVSIRKEYEDEIQSFVWRINEADDALGAWEKAHYVDGLVMALLGMFPTAERLYVEHRAKALSLFSSLSEEEYKLVIEIFYEIDKDMYKSLVQKYKEV